MKNSECVFVSGSITGRPSGAVTEESMEISKIVKQESVESHVPGTNNVAQLTDAGHVAKRSRCSDSGKMQFHGGGGGGLVQNLTEILFSVQSY